MFLFKSLAVTVYAQKHWGLILISLVFVCSSFLNSLAAPLNLFLLRARTFYLPNSRETFQYLFSFPPHLTLLCPPTAFSSSKTWLSFSYGSLWLWFTLNLSQVPSFSLCLFLSLAPSLFLFVTFSFGDFYDRKMPVVLPAWLHQLRGPAPGFSSGPDFMGPWESASC